MLTFCAPKLKAASGRPFFCEVPMGYGKGGMKGGKKGGKGK